MVAAILLPHNLPKNSDEKRKKFLLMPLPLLLLHNAALYHTMMYKELFWNNAIYVEEVSAKCTNL